MVKAYVLVEIEGVDANKVARDITEIDEVENVHLIYGEYDLIVEVKAKNLVSLKDIALEKLGKVKGVIKTSTLIVADSD